MTEMYFELHKPVQKYLNTLLKEDFYKEHALQLDKICKKLLLNFYFAKFKNPTISGMLYEKNGKYNIYVNKDHPITRQRFTAAHEIGHYISAICESYSKQNLFNSDKKGFTDYNVLFRDREERGINFVEIEADLIAAELLMPQKKVIEFIDNENLEIEEMANRFFVSQPAMTIRAKHLWPQTKKYTLCLESTKNK